MDLCCLCRRKTHRRLPDKHDHSESRDTASCPLPQELLDECMSYLNYNSTDLKVCALVCRSWSAAAQRLLFNVVVVTAPPRRYSRIEQTLRTSPHLMQYIHTLVLHRNSDVKINVFEKFCTLPFTHVENISISHSCTVTLPSAIALQRLLCSPVLRRVAIECEFDERGAFSAMWNGCSPTIRHLHLRSCDHMPHPAYLIPPRSSAPVVLESLRLEGSTNVDAWLQHDHCPFDFSRLAVLTLEIHASLPSWPRMAAALQSIEALDFSAYVCLRWF